MIRKLLATTALATLVATAAIAQEATTPAPAPAPAPMTQEAAPAAPMCKADGYLATNMIGETVYNGTGDNAENIGDVNDIVIGKDGKSKRSWSASAASSASARRTSPSKFAELDWAEKDGDRWLVAPMTKEQLEAQAGFRPQRLMSRPRRRSPRMILAMAPADV